MTNNKQKNDARVLAARWILPVSRPPIHGGWIRLSGQRIVEIGTARTPAEAQDLGDVAILPGLVNAHTHLEFSDCRTPIGQPGVELHDWIRQVITARGDTTIEKKQNAIAAGINESIAAGVRLLGEITTPPCDYPKSDQIEWVSFAEVLGLRRKRGDERLQAASDHNQRHEFAGWSPHAPYSTSRELVQSCVQHAQQTDRPLAMHVAESPAERELLVKGCGPFAETLRSLGVWQDGLFPWSDDPLSDLIDLLSPAPRVLLVHGNDFRGQEIETIAQYPNMTVVYCPRTHAFFGYDRHPVADLIKAGVRVALGTDSRASNPDLNLWSEAQFLLKHRNDLSLDQILQMATINGADAMGRTDVGRIEIGCNPGFGIVSTTASTARELARDFAIARLEPLR